MRPYRNIRLTDGPDIVDIKVEGRKSRVGKFPGKSGDCRPYCRSAHKKKVRRVLKHRDEAIQKRLEQGDEKWT